MKTLLLIMAALFSTSSQAKLLVYEFLIDDDAYHGTSVTQIACRNLVYKCETFYSENLNLEDVKAIESELKDGDVINMSFGFQKPKRSVRGYFYNAPLDEDNPDVTYEEKLLRFNTEVVAFERVITENIENLFVAAAGNGYDMGPMKTLGVPLGNNYLIYPAVITKKNLISVAAINASVVTDKTDYRIADYSNYSVDTVDLAAPVEPNDDGEITKGNSFSAPVVSRISKKIIEEHNMRAVDVKSLVLKSVFIENLDRSIELTNDYINNTEFSVIYRIQNSSNRKKEKS